MKGLNSLIFAQLAVTLALLGFAFSQQGGDTRAIIVGAVLSHWLSETPRLGQQVAASRTSAPAGG